MENAELKVCKVSGCKVPQTRPEDEEENDSRSAAREVELLSLKVESRFLVLFFFVSSLLSFPRGPVTFSYGALTPYQHVGWRSRTGAEGEFFSYAALWKDEATRQWKSLTTLVLLLLSSAARLQLSFKHETVVFPIRGLMFYSFLLGFYLFCFSPPLAGESSTEPCRLKAIGDLALCLQPPSKRIRAIRLIFDIFFILQTPLTSLAGLQGKFFA